MIVQKTAVIILLLLTFFKAIRTTTNWQTPYEQSGFQKTPRYSETMAFCQKLATYSPWVHFTDFGTSPQGRKLPLLIVDRDGDFEPIALRDRQKAVVLVLAGIHAGEIDGKDAGLMLIRDLVIHKRYLNLLDHVTLMFIPIFNVDGHERFGPFHRINQNGPLEMGWRTTAQNLNLNRDFLKADTPEMRAFLTLFTRWLPDLLIDCHVTNGADYQYELTYIIDQSPLLPDPLRSWAREVLEPEFIRQMRSSRKRIFPYFWIRDRKNLQQGLIHPTLSPRFSTGYGSIQNRIFMLLETHMLKPYKTRVEVTYAALKSLLTIVNQQANTLPTLNQQADKRTAEQLSGRWLPLKFQVDTRDTTWVDFLGVDYQISRSDISGTDWIQYRPIPRTYRVPFFDQLIVQDSARIPYAYLIPPQWTSVIQRLKWHGVQLQYLLRDTVLTILSYRFNDPGWQKRPFEGRHLMTYRYFPIEETRFFPAGTAVVIMNQRSNRVVAHLLEPGAPDALLVWGFWNTIFEQKEYAELYKLEQLARKMLAEDPRLREAFLQKLNSDSAFAANPRARLYFFYQRSPYWDQKLNRYPVGKLMKKVYLPITTQSPIRLN